MFNKEKKCKNLWWGVLAGVLECVYIFIVVLFTYLVGKEGGNQTTHPLLGGLIFLSLFVVSVLISGVLVLGKPIKLILKGDVKDAVKMFFASLATIILVFVIYLIVIILV